MTGLGEVIVAELVGMRDDIKRMSKTIEESDTRNEIVILKEQIQELQGEIRKKRAIDSDVHREDIGRKQGAVTKAKSTNKEQSRDCSLFVLYARTAT